MKFSGSFCARYVTYISWHSLPLVCRPAHKIHLAGEGSHQSDKEKVRETLYQ